MLFVHVVCGISFLFIDSSSHRFRFILKVDYLRQAAFFYGDFLLWNTTYNSKPRFLAGNSQCRAFRETAPQKLRFRMIGFFYMAEDPLCLIPLEILSIIAILGNILEDFLALFVNFADEELPSRRCFH